MNRLLLLTLAALSSVAWVLGCGASYYASSTTAIYQISPDGKKITYQSNKEQQGLELDLTEDPATSKVVTLHIKVDKAGTPDSVVAAAQASTLKLIDLLNTLLPLIEKSAGT